MGQLIVRKGNDGTPAISHHHCFIKLGVANRQIRLLGLTHHPQGMSTCIAWDQDMGMFMDKRHANNLRKSHHRRRGVPILTTADVGCHPCFYMPSPSSCAANWSLRGKPGLAPSIVHLQAATTAPSRNICSGVIPVVIPYITDPMKASPAPVVSATAPGGRPAAVATRTRADTGGPSVPAADATCNMRSST